MRIVSLEGSRADLRVPGGKAPMGYEEARAIQQQLVAERAEDRIPDTLVFVEHTPVITRGRGLQFTGEPRPRHMPVPVALPAGMEFAESERGGDLTVHGPGQLVIYPIVKLDGSNARAPHHDIAAFLRGFEALMIDVLGEWGIKAEPREGATGVWVPTPERDLKIASMGIAVRKWVTWHGLALNVVNDLRPFHLISPCGFAPEVMTRMMDQVSPDALVDWRERLEKRIALRWV